MFLPEELQRPQVSAPGQFQWAITERDKRRLLSIYLAAGGLGEVPLRIQGTLGRPGPVRELSLPRIEVLGVTRQQGDIAVQADPAFDIEPRALVHCHDVPPATLDAWLNPQQRQPVRLALHYGEPDYGGTLRLSLRKADVVCDTISNVRVTDRAVEETIVLTYTIHRAGIRAVSFLLPASMADARISVPMLRQKTIEPVADTGKASGTRTGKAGGMLRVRIDLQDDVM
ncbi:MAG: hypothetical protein ABSG68_01505, partial [Thermoguttaceae bacterium]